MLRLDLKKIRKDLTLTQRKFAEMFDVPQSFISQIENGKDPMPAHWIPKLTQMLNISNLSIYQLAVTNVKCEQEVLNRLKQFFDFTRLSQSRISLQLGLTQRMVANILNGDSKLNLTVLLSISTGFPALNLNWLMRGEGDMIINTQPNSAELERINKLVDTITTLQDTINAKSETIALLNERIKELENQLK